MKDKLAFGDCMSMVPQGDGKPHAPESFMIMKFGKNNYTLDGEEGSFDFSEVDAQSIIDEFERRGKDLLIDIEHSNLIPGQPAPAYGWVKKLSAGRDGLLAEIVDWTNEAKDYMEKKQYKYHSPVVYFDKETNTRPTSLQSISLTNHPAIHGMAPLIAANDTKRVRNPEDTEREYRKTLIDLKYAIESAEDESTKLSLSDRFNENVNRFFGFMQKRYPKTHKDREANFGKALFFSDITDKAKMVSEQYASGALDYGNAVSQLNSIKVMREISASEAVYVDSLINQIVSGMEEQKQTQSQQAKAVPTKTPQQALSEKPFFRNPFEVPKVIEGIKSVSGQYNDEQGASMKVKKIAKMLSLADAKGKKEEDEMIPAAEVTVAEEEMLPGEMPMEEGAGAEEIPVAEGEEVVEGEAEVEAEEMPNAEILASIETKIKEIVDALKQLGKALGEDVATDEEMTADVAAYADRLMIKINERNLRPERKEVEKQRKVIAANDLKVKRAKAEKSVDEAIGRGVLCESHREWANDFCYRDGKAFSDHYGPQSGAPVVVPMGVPAEIEKEDQAPKAKKYSFTDSQLKVKRAFGLSEAEAVEYFTDNKTKKK